MPVTHDQAQMLTALAVACRPTGATRWDPAGVMANIRKIADWQLPLAIEHVIRHATDPKAQSPGVIASNYTPPATTPARRGDLPPRTADECPDHPGQYPPPHCAAHATANNPAWYDTDPDQHHDDPRAAARIAAGLTPKETK